MKITPVETHKLTPEQEKLKEVSRAYEALFVNQLVTEMRKSVERGGLIPESQAEKVYQSMLDSKYSEQIADSEQLGLSKLIYEQLLRSSGIK